jgi:hypothetical protein
MRQSDLLHFQSVILEDCPLFPTLISPLEPSRKFMYRKFLLLKTTRTASQLICVFYMILKTKKIYYPTQQYYVRYYNRDGESVYCAVGSDSQ